MKYFNFTKNDIEKLTPPEKGLNTYFDTGFKGLKLYVTANGVKTFFIRKMVNGRDERFILGQYPDLSVQNARDKALITLSELANGKNPNEEKKANRAEQKLGDLFIEFMERYSKKDKKSWKYDQREIPKFYSDWFKRRLSDIKKTEIQRRHEKIRDEHGLYQANRCLERLRAMYNKAIYWGWEGQNPTNGIKKYTMVKRDRYLLPHERKAFFESLNQEENFVAKTYFYMALFTGARKTNVLEMRWKDIDFDTKCIDVTHTLQRVYVSKKETKIIYTTPKTQKSIRRIPLAKVLYAKLKEMSKDYPKDAFVLTGSTDKWIEPLGYRYTYKSILQHSRVKYKKYHTLRHTFATRCVKVGMDTKSLSEILGHANVTITLNIYVHSSFETKNKYINKL